MVLWFLSWQHISYRNNIEIWRHIRKPAQIKLFAHSDPCGKHSFITCSFWRDRVQSRQSSSLSAAAKLRTCALSPPDFCSLTFVCLTLTLIHHWLTHPSPDHFLNPVNKMEELDVSFKQKRCWPMSYAWASLTHFKSKVSIMFEEC